MPQNFGGFCGEKLWICMLHMERARDDTCRTDATYTCHFTNHLKVYGWIFRLRDEHPGVEGPLSYVHFRSMGCLSSKSAADPQSVETPMFCM